MLRVAAAVAFAGAGYAISNAGKWSDSEKNRRRSTQDVGEGNGLGGVSLDEFLRLDQSDEGENEVEWERAKMRLLKEEHDRQILYEQEQLRREAEERERKRAVELEAVMRMTLEEEKAKERVRIEGEIRADLAAKAKEEEARLRMLEEEGRHLQLLGKETEKQYEQTTKQLQEERSRLNQMLAQLERQRSDLSAKENALAQKENALVQKEGALVNKEVALQQQASKLMQQSSALAKKEQEMALKEITAQAKAQEVAAKEATLAAKAKEVAETQEAMAVRAQEVKEMQEAMAEKAKEVAQKQEAIEDKAKEVAQKQEAIADKAKEVAKKQEAIAERSRELQEMQDAIEKRSLARAAVITARENDYFDEANFQRWIRMRLGTGGKTTYWYSSGELYSYPDGQPLVRVEGFDATRAVIASPNVVHQLSRKIFIFRDKDTNEVLFRYNGTPVMPIKYPYQHISYTLDGKKLLTEANSNSSVDGDQSTLRGNVVSVRHMTGTSQSVFTCPVFLNLQTPNGSYLAYENYDYFMDRHESDAAASHCSMVRIGATPPFAESAVMHLVGWRLDSFNSLPQTIRDYVDDMKDPMWRDAPKDLEDIRRLQKSNKVAPSNIDDD